MESSRLKRAIIIISTILLIGIMGITMGGRQNITLLENVAGRIVTPIQKGFYAIGNGISSKIAPIINVWEIIEINESLIAENESLKEELIDKTLTKLELEELSNLKEALNYTNKMAIDNYISCDVVAKEQGNWFNMFTIDAGKNQGITKNSAVINGSGLVGLVYEAGDNWAKVVSVIDNKASVGFQTLDHDINYVGQLNGSVDFDLTGYLFDPTADIEEGITLITSGMGVYPKGILIGKIAEVKVDKNELLTGIVVEPFVNFKQIDKVMVIPYEELN
ncbi:MAG: rod shape-determining protein MreC [Clostridia bacterium]|nr:rod shape-determining protein MreC [Clostridia bacterium]